MQECPGRGDHQQKTDPELVLFEAGCHDHGFADKAAEQGKGRNGQSTDQGKDKGPRHLLVESAQFGEFAFSGHVEHRTGTHKQQPFVENMGKGVGASAVDGHLAAKPDPGDHVADLTDDVVGEQLPGVVLQHGIDHAVEGHDDAQQQQDFHSGKAAAEGIDRGLGGEGAEENRTGDGGLAVGVRQPGMQGRHGGVEEEADQYQPGGKIRMGNVHRAK